AKAAIDRRPHNAGLNALTWDYHTEGAIDEPVVTEVLQEINGRRVADGSLVSGFRELKADGTTACGCWVYSGVFPEPGRNRANERKTTGGDPFEPEWGFAWPNNVRVLYNRASADPEGRPWSERKKLIWWDSESRRWVGLDKPPEYQAPPGARGMAAIAGTQPFTMKCDGLGWLYPPGIKDGPLPTHYEPVESPVGNLLYPKHSSNPTVRFFEGPLNHIAHTP